MNDEVLLCAAELHQEPPTPDDLEDIREARAEYARGETVPHDAINWD